MTQFEEAREAFLKHPTAEAALLLHRVAWRAYLEDKISESDLKEAMAQVELLISPAASCGAH
jgi:hypothetical protein